MTGSFKNRVSVCILVLVSLAAFWCVSGPNAHAQTGRRCLWTVSSGQNTVYLLGSIHLLSRWDYPLPEVFEKAYAASRIVVFETDVAVLEAPGTRELMTRHSLLPKGRIIQEVISAQTFRMLEKHLVARGLPMVQFQGLRPWVCALTLTMLELSQRGYLPAYGLDRYFYENARRDRKKIVALEPAEEQLALFFELDREEQDAFLKRTLKDLHKVDTLFPEMLALWESGDVEKLDKVMHASFAEHPALYDKFLVQRNLKWLPLIEGLMGQPENALVIVGASHLGGEKGVLRLLTEKGYRVVQR